MHLINLKISSFIASSPIILMEEKISVIENDNKQNFFNPQ